MNEWCFCDFFLSSSSLDSPVGQAVGKTSDGLDAVTQPLYCQSPPPHDTYSPRAALGSKDAGEDKKKQTSFKSVYAGVTVCVTSRTQFVWLIWATCDASIGKALPTNTRPKRPMAGARRWRSTILTSHPARSQRRRRGEGKFGNFRMEKWHTKPRGVQAAFSTLKHKNFGRILEELI